MWSFYKDHIQFLKQFYWYHPWGMYTLVNSWLFSQWKPEVWEHNALSNVDTSFAKTQFYWVEKTYVMGNTYVPKQLLNER